MRSLPMNVDDWAQARREATGHDVLIVRRDNPPYEPPEGVTKVEELARSLLHGALSHVDGLKGKDFSFIKEYWPAIVGTTLMVVAGIFTLRE